jgi:hypothetical protein
LIPQAYLYVRSKIVRIIACKGTDAVVYLLCPWNCAARSSGWPAGRYGIQLFIGSFSVSGRRVVKGHGNILIQPVNCIIYCRNV